MQRNTLIVGFVAILVIAWSCSSERALAQRGFADLHAHPVSHLAFGHADYGLCSEGLFHGRPGYKHDPSASGAAIAEQIAKDLGQCEPQRHSRCPIPPHLGALVQMEQRAGLLTNLETGTIHGPFGAPSYDFWPHASSVTHQQMHLAWLYNAYRGGLRFMIASITDNEMLSKYYHDDAYCGGVFEPDGTFSFESAARQIEELEAIDDLNDWLEIVYTPEQAQTVIDDGRLAIVLGLEMDALSFEQIKELVERGVRSVIPIHLTDNEFGGAAVYADLFNALTGWQNGKFFRVEEDETVAFRLGHPSALREERQAPLCFLEGPEHCCSIQPKPIPEGYYSTLGYGPPVAEDGHRNANGISYSQLKELMALEQGLLIDVAHMGWRSTDETLALLAEPYGYPVINSHTGVREGCAHEEHASERDLTHDHLQRIARLGGVIGLGTVGEPPGAPLVATRGWPAERITTGAPDWRLYRYPFDRAPPSGTKIASLTVRVRTGGDELRGGGSCSPSKATLVLDSARGTSERVLNEHSGGLIGFEGGSLHVVEWDTAADLGPLLIDDIFGFKLVFESGGGFACDPDNWNVDSLHIEYTTDSGASRGLLVERRGVPWRRFSDGESHEITLARPYLADPALRGRAVESLELKLRIDDDEEDGFANGLVLVVGRHDGQVLRGDLVRDFGFPAGFGKNAGDEGSGSWTLNLGSDPLRYEDIEAIWLESYDEMGDSHFDHGEIDWLAAGFSDGSSSFALVDYSHANVRGEPTFNLSDRHGTTVFQGLPADLAPSTPVFALGFEVLTGRDNLEAGADVRLVLLLADGSERDLPLNEGARWEPGPPFKSRKLFVDPPIDAGDIIGVELRAPFSGDNWNIDRFVVRNLSDPADAWVQEFNTVYDEWVDAVGDEPAIALGTDFNGLSPQMPFATSSAASDGGKLELLPEDFRIERDDDSTGVLFTFEKDGLIHYGMLPSFLNAASARESRLAWSLYSSADASVEAWRGSVAAAARIRDGEVVGAPVVTGECRPD